MNSLIDYASAVSDLYHTEVKVEYRVGGFERARLQSPRVIYDHIRDGRDHRRRDLDLVMLSQMKLCLTRCRSSGIKRKYQVVEAAKAGLPFRDDLRPEARVAVARHLYREGGELTFKSFAGLTVTGVVSVVPCGRLLLIAEAMSYLSRHTTFQYCFCELF
jgi:hypothetical protein